MKHISKNRSNNYTIRKTINYKTYYFGTHSTLEEARKHRDKLIKNNWNNQQPPYKIRKEPKNIYKSNKGYKILKMINGEYIYYGQYSSLKEAKKQLKILKKHNWNPELGEKQRKQKKHVFSKEMRYIQENGTSYVIYKYNKEKGKQESYGSYRTLKDAQAERDALIRCNWDYDLLCETTQGEIR